MRSSIRSAATVMAIALLALTGAQGANFRIDLASYDEAVFSGSSAYYSDNNFSADGNFLLGVIGYGPREIGHADGSVVNGYAPATHSSKAAVQLGSYIFYSHQDGGGIGRLDAATWTGETALVNPTNAAGVGSSCEAICTDGTLIFGNDDHGRTNIHAWAVNNSAGSFTMIHQWTVSLPVGRVRGFSYANGYIYACGFGTSGDRSIYAIRVSDQAITDMGVDVPGTDTGYGTIRSGNLLMAVTVGNVYVWDLTCPTTADAASMDTYTQAQLIGGNMYSLSYRAGRLLVGTVSKTRVFDATPRLLPLLSGELRLKRTMTLNSGSTYNPRMYGDEVFAVDITDPYSVGRYLPGSTTPDVANNSTTETRMLSPMGGASTTWLLAGGGSVYDHFKRFDYATMTSVAEATNLGDLEPNSFAWVDSDTVICGSYQTRYRLFLFDITADPFSVTANTTWNANGYVDTAAGTGARIRNVTVGDWYDGYAYYADSLVTTPTIYALNLATGVETAIGSLTVTYGYAGVWQCKEVEGYMYVQTTGDGIFVYDMTDATTLGTLYTHHTKAQLDAVTGDGTQNYGSDVNERGRSILLSAGSGKIAELGTARVLPFFEDFESDYGNGNAITDYHGWTGDSDAVATSTAAIDGSLGGYVPAESAISNEFLSGSSDRMWTDLQYVPALWGQDEDPVIECGLTATFYLNSNGYPVVSAGPAAWLVKTTTPDGDAVTPYTTGAVARATVLHNYRNKTWALFFDEVLVAEQLGFVDDAISSFSLFGVSGGETEMDNLSITNMYPAGFPLSGGADQDDDGLADVWEIHYLDTIAYDENDDPDSDYASNLREQTYGTDPLDPLSVPPSGASMFILR